ncbi:MAG: hypothetical protein Q9226_005663 [Calogaya cf. arnoldii]
MDESIATVPRQYKTKQADISFATASVKDLEDPNTWQSIGIVGPCVFEHALTISQKLGGAACTDENEEAALRLPLAQKYKQITHLRLLIQPNKLEPSEGLAKSVDMMVGHLRALLTGIDSHALENNWRKISNVDHLALEYESKAQRRSLREFTGCRIRTRQGRNKRFLLIEVYRSSDNTTGDNEGEEDQVTPKVPPILGSGGKKTSVWVLDVAKETDNDQSGAIFIGVVKNSLGGRIPAILNMEEDNVSLIPIFNDIQGDRAHVAIRKYSAKADFESQSSYSFDVDPVVLQRPKSKIATVDELLGDLNYDETKNTLAEDNILLPANLRVQLNSTQAKALEMASRHSVSILHGPPGTRKSRTLAAFIWYLVVSRAQKIAGIAVQNVAIDTLLDSSIEL